MPNPSSKNMNLYDKCKCGELTAHKSGLCKACRTHVCWHCDKTFVALFETAVLLCSKDLRNKRLLQYYSVQRKSYPKAPLADSQVRKVDKLNDTK